MYLVCYEYEKCLCDPSNQKNFVIRYLSSHSLIQTLFRFKFEVDEQGGFVINDAGKKSHAPWLIIQAEGVVSRLLAPCVLSQ